MIKAEKSHERKWAWFTWLYQSAVWTFFCLLIS